MGEYIANEIELKNGGESIENFCLRPKHYTGQSIIARIKINEKWSGWKVREDIISRLQLEVGATMVNNVSVYFTNGLSADVDDIALFASDEGADWLINNKVGAGDVIDCQVKLSYTNLPAGPQRSEIPSASLIFEKGIAVIERGTNHNKDTDADAILGSILKTLAE